MLISFLTSVFSSFHTARYLSPFTVYAASMTVRPHPPQLNRKGFYVKPVTYRSTRLSTRATSGTLGVITPPHGVSSITRIFSGYFKRNHVFHFDLDGSVPLGALLHHWQHIKVGQKWVNKKKIARYVVTQFLQFEVFYNSIEMFQKFLK